MMDVLGDVCGAAQLLDITANLATYLATLTETLNDPDADIDVNLRLLATEVKVAGGSYLGLTVMTRDGFNRQISLTMLEPISRYRDVLTSFQVGTPAQLRNGIRSAPVELTLYAHIPGAFVDLAAGLAWRTGRSTTEFLLDQHLTRADTPNASSSLGADSLIDQAMGVLIAGGYTPEGARYELDARAARLQVDRRGIAAQIVDAATGT